MEAAVSRPRARRLALAYAAVCGFVPGTKAADLPAKPAELIRKLRAQVQAVDARLDGVLGVYVEDLTGASVIELRADEVFPTASSIKLAVLYELYRQADEGRLDLTEVTRPPLPRVAGGGVLQGLGDRVSLTWRDLAVLTHVWSDNEAANLLIRRVGMDAVNRRLDALALPRTRLRREMLDLAAARRGDENVSTPRELARLAAMLARGEGLTSDRARDLLALATLRDPASFFRRALPEGQRALNKRGELEGVRCDAGWVDVPGRPYTATIMTAYLKHESDGEAAIAELSAAIYSTFDRLARSSEYGRIISERDTGK